MNKILLFFIFLFLISFSFVGSWQSLSVKAAGNQWSRLSSMPTKRGNHRAIEFSGRIFVIGGQNENGFPALVVPPSCATSCNR